MIADPPVRADGRCAMCPKKRHPERSRKYAGTVAEVDPFCSVGFFGSGGGFTHGTRESYRLCACELCTAAVKGAKV